MILRSIGLFKDFFPAESASKCGLASQIVKLMHYSGLYGLEGIRRVVSGKCSSDRSFWGALNYFDTNLRSKGYE
jgi:hypothetical protein